MYYICPLYLTITLLTSSCMYLSKKAPTVSDPQVLAVQAYFILQDLDDLAGSESGAAKSASNFLLKVNSTDSVYTMIDKCDQAAEVSGNVLQCSFLFTYSWYSNSFLLKHSLDVGVLGSCRCLYGRVREDSGCSHGASCFALPLRIRVLGTRALELL